MTDQTTHGGGVLDVRGYPVVVDRAYDPDTHVWVQVVASGRVRIGMDALGVETSGTLAQLSFVAPGTPVGAGQPFGSLEAAKFVGPLTTPVGGVVVATNDDVLADPGLVERDPYGAGWLVEVATHDPDPERRLLRDPQQIEAWFADEIDDYRIKGVIAE